MLFLKDNASDKPIGSFIISKDGKKAKIRFRVYGIW